MENYLNQYQNFLADILSPSWSSYFYSFILISLTVYSIELLWPWRKDQARLRRDFWLDLFYCFFNLFIIHILFLKTASSFFREMTDNAFSWIGWQNYQGNLVQSLPLWGQILLIFILKDFIQWNIHRLLHKVPLLWRFHQVHHSVKDMGFAAHLRYHWMENTIYNSIQYIPLAIIGFGLDQYFFIYITTISIGHLNHANTTLPIGPFKYIINSPQMHIWHHAKDLPPAHPSGCNFGLTLSCWDYIFKTAYIPYSGRDIELGFENDSKISRSFLKQLIHGFKGPN